MVPESEGRISPALIVGIFAPPVLAVDHQMTLTNVPVTPAQRHPTASLSKVRGSNQQSRAARGAGPGKAKLPLLSRGNLVCLHAFEVTQTLLLNCCLPACRHYLFKGCWKLKRTQTRDMEVT